MTKFVRFVLVAALAAPSLITATGVAAQETARADRHYVGLLATTLNHRSIGGFSQQAAWGTGTSLILGGHITDRFHAELRAGIGVKDAEVPDSNLTLAVDYFASWYIGMHYPIADNANIYGQFGFSYIDGEAELNNRDADRNREFQSLEGEFPDSSFSVSWLAGLDFEVADRTFVVLEGGKLFKDSGSDVNTFQFSGGVRYEF